ncbi:hypothetical protein NFL61_23040 (plasmid) [Enterobacter ludwigii]|uniref:hypothetical protein n=1 Tax=Enterobacter TaxID=547 RepID=UPI002167BB9B|nr:MULTISPECIES: hypothetical protein [Enterobacter]MCS3490821.1 hypothetical protein [Enterobacter sp. SLBN-59]WGC22780.1 hypothetical protein NFL61_23040 [Enterobacter ludwigii]
MTAPQKLPRKEVFLVMKEISGGEIVMAEGLLAASNYYFDALGRAAAQQPSSVTLEEFDPQYRLAQMIHLPDERTGKWHATHHSFGGWPEFVPEMEYIVSVAAYSNSKARTLEMLKAGVEYSDLILNGSVAPREGEFPFDL